MKVLFLDRDGIINMERGQYTFRKSDFTFTNNLCSFLTKFVNQGFKLIVVTNQGGIDKGLYSKKDVEELHAWMLNELKSNGIDVLDVYYCPHHDSIQKCLCRKPKNLLFEKSVARYGIDTSHSLMIGDSQRDIDAAATLGINGYLFDANPDWNIVNTSDLLK